MNYIIYLRDNTLKGVKQVVNESRQVILNKGNGGDHLLRSLTLQFTHNSRHRGGSALMRLR